MLIEIVLLLLALFALYQVLKPKTCPNFPPGPSAYPIVGSVPALLKLDSTIPGAFEKLHQIYGPVTGLFLGKNKAIIINGWKAAKEVLSRDEFNCRPTLVLALHSKLQMPLGILFLKNNEFLKTQRRFALRRLRDWGFGKTTLEGIIHEEIEECFVQFDKKIQASDDGSIPIHSAFGFPMINILWAVVAGKRYAHDDENLNELLERINATFRSRSHAQNFINDYPWLRHLPYFSQLAKDFLETRKSTERFIEEAIDEHLETRDRKSPRDFIDEYLDEIDSEKEKGNKETSFFREQLVAICMDIFSAGAESTSNSVAFAILYMMIHPEVQQKVYDEISSVLGDKLPSYEDRTKLPFTEAVLAEVQRVANIAPTAVPHYSMRDTTLNGYNIPKETIIFISLTSVHMEKDLWGDPENFRPERFLVDGKFVKPEYLIPFGLGKRMCMGDSLAKTNYFLITAAMLQRFEFSVAPGASPPSTVPVTGFTVAPHPFSAVVRQRSHQ